jgi:hypothetical protein
MSKTEILLRKTEALPPALLEEAVHYYRLFITKSTERLFFGEIVRSRT